MKIGKGISLLGIVTLGLVSCSEEGPVAIEFNKDQCDNCKMVIEKAGYASELVTSKGKAYKFDDIKCMHMFEGDNEELAQNAKTYVTDFKTSQFIEESKATLVQGGAIKSPMGGDTQAFANKADAEEAAKKLGASLK